MGSSMKRIRRLLRLVLVGWVFASVGALLLVRRWLQERYSRGGPIPVSQAMLLLNPVRQRMHPARKTLEAFQLAAGQTVLELGPGPGYFTPEAASIVGPQGRVVCVDLQPGMLALLQDRLREHQAGNACPVAADATRLPLADGSVDAAFLVAVLGEVPDRPAALAELRRVLRPGGTLSFLETLTDPDYVFVDTMKDLCRAYGFDLIEHRRLLLGYTMTFAAASKVPLELRA
jgi:ubiquinone/menaquinone biosynthesis C-methylase UbiE